VANRVGRDEARVLYEAILGLTNPGKGVTVLIRCEVCFKQRTLDEMNPIFDPDDLDDGFLGWECWEHDI
jgi:hypothetical protein